jgi:hypothetical protein
MSTDPYALASLGKELDAARRARLPVDDSAVEDTDSLSPLSSPPTARRSLSTSSAVTDRGTSPLPLCLLCLTRPPSAVLLPCKLCQVGRVLTGQVATSTCVINVRPFSCSSTAPHASLRPSPARQNGRLRYPSDQTGTRSSLALLRLIPNRDDSVWAVRCPRSLVLQEARWRLRICSAVAQSQIAGWEWREARSKTGRSS